jgi:hypothetical protein
MADKKLSVILGAVGLSLCLAGWIFSGVPVVLSRWAASPLHIDGLVGEWESGPLLHIDKIDVDCAFMNDGRDLFILLVFKDPESLISIESTGITIRYGPKEDPSKNGGVRFNRIVLTTDQYISALENQGVHLTEGDKEGLHHWPQHFLFAAYAVDKDGKTIPAPASSGGVEPPTFRTRRRQNGSTYEFRLPLSLREAYPAGIEAKPGQSISVFFEWGGSAQKALSPKTSWSTPGALVSGGAIGDNDETRAQEFLNSFDSMSRPSLETKKFSFGVQVQLAKPS